MGVKGINPQIMMGTAQLGLTYGITNRTGMPDDNETAKILAFAEKSGVSWIDTARAYGSAEKRLGEFLPGTSAFNIVTKLQPMDLLPEDAPAREIVACVDASIYKSRRELRRERLDVAMFHSSKDAQRANGAALERLGEHLKEGLIGAIGSSVYAVDEALKALEDKRITHIQIPFNLLDSRWLCDMFLNQLRQRPDVKIHVRSVFLQGLLINNADLWPSWFAERGETSEKINVLVKRADRKNRIDLCLAYVRSFPWVSSLVLGAETLRQWEELITLFAEPILPEAQLAEVKAMFAGIPARLLNPSQW